MLVAFISAFASAGSTLIDKLILTKRRVPIGVLLPIGFILIAGISLFLVPFLGRVDWEIALMPNSLFLLAMMIVLALAWNVLYFQGLQKEKMHQHELMMMLVPLITIILAAVFWPQEFNRTIFILALIASVALVFAKGQKEHFFLDKDSYNTFLAAILIAMETIIIRELLYFYTPVAIFSVRAIILAIFFMFYYRPRYSKVSIRNWWAIAGSASVAVVLVLTRYYALAEIGVIYTMLVLVLAPMIVYFFSWELLNEKIKPRVLIASVVILTCVALATLHAIY